jgi:hypothetical protein
MLAQTQMMLVTLWIPLSNQRLDMQFGLLHCIAQKSFPRKEQSQLLTRALE